MEGELNIYYLMLMITIRIVDINIVCTLLISIIEVIDIKNHIIDINNARSPNIELLISAIRIIVIKTGINDC
jgi:hypothetical protein